MKSLGSISILLIGITLAFVFNGYSSPNNVKREADRPGFVVTVQISPPIKVNSQRFGHLPLLH